MYKTVSLFLAWMGFDVHCSTEWLLSQQSLRLLFSADAESIRIRYDPSIISYGELLELMFHYHTPADPRWAGTQYRSAIFVYNDQQRKMAESYLKDKVGGKLATYVAVEDASDFYKAEEYHQKYLEKAVSNMY